MDCAIKIIQNAYNNNKLTIFVGAGISKASNLPSWDELISKIKINLSLDERENDYLKIAQLFYLSCGEVVYYQEIKKFFSKNIEPTIIQKMIFDLKPSHIITTNWDNLLEKTAQNNGFIYDLIVKDKDLVQSELQNHIIKMHGDFNNNNIVFKEDDYINYKMNFPLMENYIKSILSTNTILFLGYSYNDINLKQITKWIQNNSESMPPMFLTIFNENKNQSKYLENFGIKTIVLTNEKDFKLDSYSNKIATFLEYLNSPLEEMLIVDSMTDENTIDFIYEKLVPFDIQNSILLKQIQTTLTNCGYIFDDKNRIFLEFYEEILTYDVNKNLRMIYKKFKEIKIEELSDNYKNKIYEIHRILIKANIDGIITTSDSLQINQKEYLALGNSESLDDFLKRLCNFDFNDIEVNENETKLLMKKAFFYFQKYEYENAYITIQQVISICFKDKNYIYLFFAMFNHNILLNYLKFDFRIGKETNDKYHTIRYYDLDEKFYEMPKPIQKILKDVKPFLSYDYLYKFIFEIDDELNKKQKQKKSILEHNGFSFDSNITRNYSKQKNLISFILNNCIMIERHQEFCSIQKKLIQISLIRQIQEDFFKFDKMELYVCIKYIEHKDLIEILEQEGIALNHNSKNNIEKKFEISSLNNNWLILKVFKNLIILYSKPNFSNELKNVILILSMQNLNKFQCNKLLNNIYNLIEKGIGDFDLYTKINSLIYNQKNFTDKDLVKIIELMINKILLYKYNLFHFEALINNEFYAPFFNIEENKEVFNNSDLIENFLKNLRDLAIVDKIKISQGFLFNLYLISNKKIKKLIKDFMLSIDLKKLNVANLSDVDIKNMQNFNFSDIQNYDLIISFKLFLAIKELVSIDKKFLEEVKEYPNHSKGNFNLIGQITGQVRYLVEKKNEKELESLLQILLNEIDKINEKKKQRKMRSTI